MFFREVDAFGTQENGGYERTSCPTIPDIFHLRFFIKMKGRGYSVIPCLEDSLWLSAAQPQWCAAQVQLSSFLHLGQGVLKGEDSLSWDRRSISIKQIQSVMENI